MSASVGHSEDYFGDYRDHWWNADFLALIGERLKLRDCRNVLDVGSGLGHWTRLLLPLLAPDARLSMIDGDPKWVQAGRTWIEQPQFASREFDTTQGLADALPYPDASFDLVTCQTLLIHVSHPVAVLNEMHRVLSPGGLLLCTEPDNLATWSEQSSSLSSRQTLDEAAAAYRFTLAMHRGRMALGLGDNAFGDRLPHHVKQAGFSGVQTWLSDKVVALNPPYASEDQQAVIRDTVEWFESSPDFSRDESLRQYVAGGGDKFEFDGHWMRELQSRRAYLDSLREGTFDSASGVLMYVVAGRKPNVAASST
ncbi:MAG: class I SAM-dependent methyltransferase [Dokdonella sp.]